jgi:hypothetical protein
MNSTPSGRLWPCCPADKAALEGVDLIRVDKFLGHPERAGSFDYRKDPAVVLPKRASGRVGGQRRYRPPLLRRVYLLRRRLELELAWTGPTWGMPVQENSRDCGIDGRSVWQMQAWETCSDVRSSDRGTKGEGRLADRFDPCSQPAAI